MGFFYSRIKISEPNDGVILIVDGAISHILMGLKLLDVCNHLLWDNYIIGTTASEHVTPTWATTIYMFKVMDEFFESLYPLLISSKSSLNMRIKVGVYEQEPSVTKTKIDIYRSFVGNGIEPAKSKCI